MKKVRYGENATKLIKNRQMSLNLNNNAENNNVQYRRTFTVLSREPVASQCLFVGCQSTVSTFSKCALNVCEGTVLRLTSHTWNKTPPQANKLKRCARVRKEGSDLNNAVLVCGDKERGKVPIKFNITHRGIQPVRGEFECQLPSANILFVHNDDTS